MIPPTEAIFAYALFLLRNYCDLIVVGSAESFNWLLLLGIFSFNEVFVLFFSITLLCFLLFLMHIMVLLFFEAVLLFGSTFFISFYYSFLLLAMSLMSLGVILIVVSNIMIILFMFCFVKGYCLVFRSFCHGVICVSELFEWFGCLIVFFSICSFYFDSFLMLYVFYELTMVPILFCLFRNDRQVEKITPTNVYVEAPTNVYVEAPTNASMILAGVMLKLGEAGVYRINKSLNFFGFEIQLDSSPIVYFRSINKNLKRLSTLNLFIDIINRL
uniref:Uncharacterized protein n=1 Tax=Onchocerca volvulus TaxID=6282 RepID=A0A2K6VIY6_ONCVO